MSHFPDFEIDENNPEVTWNHFADTPRFMAKQVYVAMDEIMASIRLIVHEIEDNQAINKARHNLDDAIFAFCKELRNTLEGVEEHQIAGLAEKFFMRLAEDAPFAAVPYDPFS
jgi:hypothetical protein